MKLFCGTLLGILTAACAVAPAQTIQVIGDGIVIQHGDTTPDRYQATLFPVARISTAVSTAFGVRNAHPTTPLVISSTTVTGPDAASFQAILFGPSTLAPGESVGLFVIVNGPVPTEKNATINLASNDPARPTFSFAVRAPVSPGVPGPFIELVVGDAATDSAIAKKNLKTGLWSLKLKTTVFNGGDIASVGGNAILLGTNNPWVTTSAPNIGTVAFKPVKARKDLDSPLGKKKLKVKLKDLSMDLSGFDYIFVLLDNPGDPEGAFYNQFTVIPLTVE
jgi:hypothetical protein